MDYLSEQLDILEPRSDISRTGSGDLDLVGMSRVGIDRFVAIEI